MLCVLNCNILIYVARNDHFGHTHMCDIADSEPHKYFCSWVPIYSVLYCGVNPPKSSSSSSSFCLIVAMASTKTYGKQFENKQGYFFFAVWFSAIGEQKILFWVLHMTFVLEATVLLLRLSELCEFVHLQEKQVVGCKLRCQANPRNRMSVVAHRMWSLCDPLDQTKGLKRRQTFVCCVLFHKKSQTLLQAAQGYNPFLEKGFCGEPFLP